jgi:serine/threonine protein phosphatase PrpC
MTQDAHQHVIVRSDWFSACGISHPGMRRSENQDSIFLDEAGAFVLLADGMGGHQRGGEASRTAVDVIRRYLGPEAPAAEMYDGTDGTAPVEVARMFSMIETAVSAANAELYSRNRREELQRFMGTTIVGLAVVPGGFAVWFHVGDSRIYRWRDAHLNRLTADHSVFADWERGGRLGDEPRKNIITRAIGPGPIVKVDLAWAPVRRGDLYLLCSDGLSDMVAEDIIGVILGSDQDMETIAQNLVDAANAAGGRDNISAVVCLI